MVYINFLKNSVFKVFDFKIVRFVFSGGMGAVTNLSILYILTDLCGLWYIYSGIVSFIVSVFVSFTLQKFFTFRDHGTDEMVNKFSIFLIVACINLSLNTSMLYFLVNEVGFHYLLAQIISNLIIAVESYFVYRFIFTPQVNKIVDLHAEKSI